MRFVLCLLLLASPAVAGGFNKDAFLSGFMNGINKQTEERSPFDVFRAPPPEEGRRTIYTPQGTTICDTHCDDRGFGRDCDTICY